MPREEKLKLGKGAAFVKSRLERLPQEEETWEADFQALPKPITQSETHYLGMVVAPGGSLLADSHIEGRPTVNYIATLLAHAMKHMGGRDYQLSPPALGRHDQRLPRPLAVVLREP